MIDYPETLALHVAGEWRIAASGSDSLAVQNPATGEVVGRLPIATDRDIDDAIGAASAAFPRWAAMSAWQREAVLRRAATLIEERREKLARLLTVENGKTLAESRGELDRVVETLSYCAEEGKRAYGRTFQPRTTGLHQATILRPVGPVAAFVPWNFPAFLAIRKVAAALAAGCSVVLKPAEECPGVCVELTRALLDAGLPSGVLNLLFGIPSQISERLIDAEQIRKISFTGSVAVGRLLGERAGRNLKPVTLELGGHAPIVIFDDVDAKKVASTCAAFKYRNAGQVCLAPSRFYVQEGIFNRFVEHFVAASCSIRVGNGLDERTNMGPLTNLRRLDTAAALVEEARKRGARVQCGGSISTGPGYFFPPTVLTDVDPAARLLQEEPFCPIAPLMPFTSLSELLPIVNESRYGLAAYAFTNRLERAHSFSESVAAGWVGINTFSPALADVPIGGIKDSGLGYEGGPEGLHAYMHSKFVSVLSAPV